MLEPGFTYKYKRTLSCERCGRIIYYDDEYRSDGYGGYLCRDCIEEMDYKEEEDERLSVNY